MNEKKIQKKIDDLWNGLSAAIDRISSSENDLIAKAEEILMETDAAVRQLKTVLRQYEFQDWSSEIHFFKVIKPKFVSVYIYYARVLAIEASKPYADGIVLRSYYENERSGLLYFYNEHRDFISYYRRKSTYLDQKYFVRFRFDFKLKLSPELYSYDEEFSTSHDHLVSQIMANDLLDRFLTNKIDPAENHDVASTETKTLEWTAPKVALIELLYALHQTRCFNGGQLDLAELFRWAENAMQVNLGNYHKTLGEIRLRKNERTKFLAMLHSSFSTHLDDLDA